MILVDTSIWIDHLRAGDAELIGLLNDNDVLAHPWVAGELALGQLSRRTEVLVLIQNLLQATVATDEEILAFIDRRHLFGIDIGYVDAHLLAATILTPGARLWTRDERLASTATGLGVSRVDTRVLELAAASR